MPTILTKVDVTKAFDSIQHSSVMSMLSRARIHPKLAFLLARELRSNALQIHFYGTSPSKNVATHCGVKQGSPDSAILFVATLGEQLRHLETQWAQQGWGFVLGPARISNTSFADDIVFLSDSPQMARQMFQSLGARLEGIGLRVNSTKTQCISLPKLPSEVLPGIVAQDNSMVVLGRVIGPPDSTDLDMDYKNQSCSSKILGIVGSTS